MIFLLPLTMVALLVVVSFGLEGLGLGSLLMVEKRQCVLRLGISITVKYGVIEEIDGDRWSVFEAYVELKHFGYVEENIPSLWFKDSTHEDMEKNLKLFKSDADSIVMCKIAELRDYVELYVVYKVEEEDVFPAAGYIDVGEKDGMVDISPADSGAKQRDNEVNQEVECGNSSDSDSLDSEYKPSGEEDDSEYDLHFIDSDDELDPDVSGFQDVNVMNKKRRAVKKKGVANEDFENDEGGNSDDLDLDHEIGAQSIREAIRFRKCDLKRVRVVCSGDCPFWLYAAKIGDEDTWQLRSMNLTHTYTQAHRVGILHSKWIDKVFKKKVEANPKVKIRELVSKAQKKWNLTVTKSLASSSVHIQVQRSPDLDNEAPASSMTNYCIFQRIYVCLEACKQSFQHCRSFIGVNEAETKDSWTWFLTHLASDIGLEKMGRSTFMSDQQKGLLPAYDDVIPGVDNRFCVRHLYSNFRKRFPGLQLKQLMWKCAKRLIRRIGRGGQKIGNLHRIIQGQSYLRLESGWRRGLGQLGSGSHTGLQLRNEVVNGLDKFAVDLGTQECSCRMWQMSDIPCVHAISCIKFKGLELEPFVDGCYKKEAYSRCYESVIHPLNGPDLWERTAHPDVMPPPYRRPSRRPVKKRRSAAGDEEQSSRTHLSRKGKKQRCSICGSVGHNKSRCPKPIENLPPSSAQSNNAAQPKRPRGRPKRTTKPNCSTQHDPQPKKLASPTSLAPPSSSSQLTTRTLPSSQPTLATSSSQLVGLFSARLSGAPHISPKN
ncbi:hypothetical protein Ahy_B06g080305 [Arachis hypogaea]|uniref:SWIM-type domain-containing protein n=1 Tax=Arachis hypogaea TaxID=3818 RepID=A0A444YHQ4_ARAHY|nr:hypothetical protein Ahy_B06g080305 [Arachis hypogaea]